MSRRCLVLMLAWLTMMIGVPALMAAGTTAPTSQPAEAPAAQTSQPSAPATTDQPFGLKSKTMTGDWFGLGPAMRDAGIDVSFFWNSHYYSVLDGGRKTGGGKHSATYDLFFKFDLDKMGLIKDAEVLVHGRQQWGRSVNPWVGPDNPGSKTRSGAQQVNDDADYSYGIYVDQLYYRQHFLERKLALQFGYLDYQTIVDKNAYANSEDKQFANAALDNNPIFPTASAAGLGATLYVKPWDWYTLILGAGDAERLPLYKPGFSTTFHDHAYFLGYVENDFHVKIPTDKGPLPGNYRFGLIYDPLPRSRYIDPRNRPDTDGNDVGFYMSHDQMMFRENEQDDQGLGWFFRYAFRHRDVNRFSNFWSTGLAYKGLIPERNGDVLGLAFAQLLDSKLYRQYRNQDSGNETIYELYSSIPVTPWFVVTPDIQYVDNPGANDSVSHAIAGGVKCRLTF